MPTWNYQSIQLYRRSLLLSKTKLKSDLKLLF
ncbi:hypothetical protein KJB58_11250 [Staphylococcus hyicus]|uniref:Uncharacterized protein n=1 Tax=Staphylococcus hyicus TaxID=1284 RepID=A0A418JIP7_STAHY|nr:hypothetical protein [Staphylococcus hyicus]RIO45637.1 hypothetical protein BUZ57_06995 [Staphylococcus hyicus]